VSLTAVRVWFVSVQVAVTLAPGSTPPVLSVIVPEMPPVVRCANAVRVVARKATSKITNTAPGRLCRMWLYLSLLAGA
jgi:hypothetical protein